VYLFALSHGGRASLLRTTLALINFFMSPFGFPFSLFLLVSTFFFFFFKFGS
jgi:hypothetical protein